jgi:hypothetical protein
MARAEDERAMPQMTIQQAIELARQRQREGDLREAESIFRQVLDARPNKSMRCISWA